VELACCKAPLNWSLKFTSVVQEPASQAASKQGSGQGQARRAATSQRGDSHTELFIHVVASILHTIFWQPGCHNLNYVCRLLKEVCKRKSTSDLKTHYARPTRSVCSFDDATTKQVRVACHYRANTCMCVY
jgi:hypothetical protein